MVGKLSSKEIKKLEDDYLKRLKSASLRVFELKSHSENLKKESDEIILKIKSLYKTSRPYLILLTENGKQLSSPEFSTWLDSKRESHGDKLIFIIGGAAGFGKDILELADFSLSLSLFTFPHKLARLLLIEQLYRAQTISSLHPYHK